LGTSHLILLLCFAFLLPHSIFGKFDTSPIATIWRLDLF